MGDGTASGVQTPDQPGVIRREGENFPWIPQKLLKLTPEELERSAKALQARLGLEEDSLFPIDPDRRNELEHSITVYQFAKTAVERAKEAAAKK